MSTHNICFYGEIRKIISELSTNTPLQVLFNIITIFDFKKPLSGGVALDKKNIKINIFIVSPEKGTL